MFVIIISLVVCCFLHEIEQALLKGHGLWRSRCFCCSCCQVCLVSDPYFICYGDLCCWLAANSITISFSFLLGACLGILSSVPSCRLHRKKGYQKLMLISSYLSSMIRSNTCFVVSFVIIFVSRMKLWLLGLWCFWCLRVLQANLSNHILGCQSI